MLGFIYRLRSRLEGMRVARRWQHLQALGMQIGRGVNLPPSTSIDVSHCFLIRIGDDCGFGPDCLILAHDAQMDEYLNAARIGRVIIHESSHIGARSVILPGVEIGPRTIVGAGSVVSKSLPPDTVCAGNPAKVICSLEEYLTKHRERVAAGPSFDYEEYSMPRVTAERREEMMAAVTERDGYIVGGRAAELRGEGGTSRVGSPTAAAARFSQR